MAKPTSSSPLVDGTSSSDIALNGARSLGGGSIPELLEQQVQRTPDRVALIVGEQRLTYHELNGRANQLAHYLVRRGVSTETPVAILAERSIQLVVAILAVLKAGGVYVPLDPDLPSQRLTAIIHDSQIGLLLIDSALKTRLPLEVPHTIVLNESAPAVTAESAEFGTANLTPENLAYIVYTSGSTGKPKGVLLPHRVFMRCDYWARDVFHFTSDDRFLFKSIRAPEELLYPLFIGASVLVAPAGADRDPGLFVSTIIKHRITAVGLSPAFLNLVLAEPDLQFAASLNHVLCSGEILPNDVRTRFHARCQANLYNFYGLAEAPYTAIHRCRAESEHDEVPIGHPVDAQVLLLNSDLQAVATGEVGEIYIGGQGVAQGYLNLPDLTSNRFISDPVGKTGQFYRTGDLAYYDADERALILVGRTDLQIKVRGFRLETGEVEAALRIHSDVREAAVALINNEHGQSNLTGYLVLEPNAGLTVEVIRRFLETKIPDYAIPTRFRVLPSLPRTSTGKLDRRALKNLLGSELPGATAYRAPGNERERQLTRIWQELLGCDRVGINDNFFHLGGHSLSATQVIARIRAELGFELPLRQFFEAPTIAELSSRLSSAGSIKSRLFHRRRSEGPVPLSFAQERLWFLDQLEPNSSAYHIPDAYLINGPLDVSLLERSLQAVAQRHELLRTTLQMIDGKPAQVIAPTSELTISMIDRSALPQAEQEAEIERQIKENSATVFDLARGPLLQLKVVRLAPERYLLLVNMHHVVSDDWSLGVLYRELSLFYTGFVTGEPVELAPMPIQYADYAACQRKWLEGGELERQLVYWRRQLADTPILELPTDFPRPPKQTFVGSRVPFALSRELTARLKAFGRHENATHFMSLLAAFQVLLSRYSGQEDIVVGTPIANRRHVELEGLFGFFVNMLVLRGDLSGEPSFREVVSRVRRTALDAYDNQDLPFDRLVEDLNPERDLSRPPLFQVMFAIQDVPTQPLSFSGAEVSRRVHAVHATHFDLELYFSTEGDAWSGFVGYNSDLFSLSTIERMIGHYQSLLGAVLAEADRPVFQVPMLTPAEQHQLLVEWNDNAVDYPQNKCLHHLFEEQVEKSPEAVAAVFGERHHTYRELNARANQLANHLRNLGVGPEALVGVCVDRSLEMVVALLGTLKAGGACVPIDPLYPKARVGFILEDADVAVVVTQKRWLSILPSRQTKIVALDDLPTASAIENIPTSLQPQNLAYVIYTSGSTGRPKGVALEHRNLIALIRWAHQKFSAEELSGVLASTSICFDLSVFELFVPLTAGGRVIVVQDILDLAALSPAKAVSLVNTVPSAIAELVRSHALPSSVVTVTLAGEPLTAELVEQIYQQPSVKRVYDLYGPSEDGTYSTCALRQANGAATIGRPITNKQTYILDQARQPVPIGVPGELYLGGDGLARGYLNRPELTAEKFIANPFSTQPGARLYRTGDLCRYLSDGNIAFLGRLDHQVKIRGFRVELGEIEATVRQHPQVEQCIVLARDDDLDHKRLIAYVVPVDVSSPPTTAQLRSLVKENLPHYMMPAAFVVLEKLPLTPNGKIDRKRLPLPEFSRAQVTQEHVAPRTPVEEVLASIWTEVLKTNNVGVHDNFFELGGHSLLATQVVARIRRVLEAEIPIRTFFEFPTIAGIAGKLSSFRDQHSFSFPTPRPVDHNGALPLSFAQQRLWFLDRFAGSSAEYNMAEAFRLQGQLNRDALMCALNAIIARHDSLRTRFVEMQGQPVQLIMPRLEMEIPLEDLSLLDKTAREEAINLVLRRECENPFDLSQGPLLRMKLLKLAKHEHILVWICHHIVSDGWSVSVFRRELSTLYKAFCEGRGGVLEPLPVQYPDYAVWQRHLLQGEQLERQLSYWRNRLSDAPTLQLPTDKPRPAVQTFTGSVQTFTLSSALTAQIKAFNREENATAFMTLLAAFQVLLSRYSGQFDIVVGTPIANRQHIELEGLIGFFANTLVLRGDLSGEPGFREVVRRVRRSALDAYQNQDLPFEKLVEDFNPERDLSRSPLFQVMFALQDGPAQPMALPGIEVSRRSFPLNTTHFDLELYLSSEGEEWSGCLSYNTDLFAPATIERMAGHYQTLLNSLLAAPDVPVVSAPMLSLSEQRQLRQWTDDVANYGSPECIHHLFEQQVVRSPASIAVEFDDQTLTYHELDLRSNALAREIQRMGVRPETRVGVCVDRSLDMVVALLATLKAGGTYVPIDIRFPVDRITHILNNAEVKVLLLHESLRPLCTGFTGKVLSLDRPVPVDQTNSAPVPVSGHNAAYIYYTSGSTGRPKGIIIEHRSVVNFLRGMQREPGIHDTDVVLALTTISFDPAVLDIFLPLSSGARVVIVPEAVRMDSDRLLELLHRSGATILQATPTIWQLLMRTDWRRKNLKALIGGEMLTPELAREILSRCGELWNLYGPTETTVWSTVGRINRPDDITIGRTIPNQRVYIVDAHNQPVPIGIPGELLIGGAGLGRHYVAEPALTAERFIPDPFSSKPGALLYRTGDLCRYRADGKIEFLGRIDHQVKIRGFRVEPGEIEALLIEHPGIDQCVVVDRVDKSGERRLIGYIVPSDPASAPDAATLREFLRRKLPDFMLPSAIVVLEKLPLTRTGKVARSALPAPQPVRRDSATPDAPRNEVEQQLSRIWEDVLQIEGIGLTDDFFQIGGHSLLAVRVIAEINGAFGVDLPLATIFRSPTVESLAIAVLNSHELQLKPPGLIAPREGETGQPIFWAPSVGTVERYVECHNLARLLRGTYRFYGFDPASALIDISSLAQHCIELIRAEQPQGPYFVAGYCQCGHVAYEIATRLERDGEEVALLAIIDASARDFGASVRQRLYWVRDGFRGNPRVVLNRVRSVVRCKLNRTNGINGLVANNGQPMNRFIAHGQAVKRHKVCRFSGTIELIRSQEWLARLPHAPLLGWNALAPTVRVHPVDCNHSAVLTNPTSVQRIVDKLKEALVCQPA